MKYEFEIEERVIQGTHNHSWIARETTSGVEFALPDGGNGKYLGWYPEIEAHLDGAYGVNVNLSHTTALGDTLTFSNDRSQVSWRFLRQSHEIVVIDIPRTVFRMTVGV